MAPNMALPQPTLREELLATLSGKNVLVIGGSSGIGYATATGALARYGVCAVDPRVIPLGTRLYVPGYGYAIAADTGATPSIRCSSSR